MTSKPRVIRLAVIVNHPIQYHAPLHNLLAKAPDIDLRVHYLTKHGLQPSFDVGFGREVSFNVPLTDGIAHTFRRNLSPSKATSGFLSAIHPQLSWDTGPAEVLLLHGYEQSSMWFAYFGARIRGIPYMLRGESRLDTDVALPGYKRTVKKSLVGPLVRSAAVCLPIGARNAAFYRAYGGPDSRLISAPYAVDNAFFQTRAATARNNRHELLRNLNLQPAAPTVILAAKLQSWKRPMDLLLAVARCSRPFNVIIAGDGPIRQELESLDIGNARVAFVGFADQPRLAGLYGISDVVTLTSMQEPWGLAINEGMAAGCLPITSDAVGCSDDLVLPTTGAVYPVGDVSALTRCLEAVAQQIGNQEVREACRAAAERHDVSVAVDGIRRGAWAAVAA